MNIWIFLIIVFCFGKVFSSAYDLRHGHRDHVINPNTVCGNTAGLSIGQANLCSQRPHSVASAIQGMQIAIHECKEQFKNHRWNCSALESKNKMPQSSAFLVHASGNRESAFSHAIASAGVVHQVAHACSLGKIEQCECPQSLQQPVHLTASQRKEFYKQIVERRFDRSLSAKSFEKAGCNHNINYGLDFAVLFLDLDEEQDFISQIRSHNNRVGRLIVSNRMKEKCRCHGTSGSCSQKTCWKETPDFKAVGIAIKKKYDSAVKVSPSIAGNRAYEVSGASLRANAERSSFSVDDLIYLDPSPTYCVPNRRINIAGTRGRYCNASAGFEVTISCRNLCCSRGYTTRTIRRVEQCRCKFHWCCYVDCEECEWEETVSVCN